jgi:tRNA threonylcarbamoyl adenosine modification protein (Sua5/YciO/YrdC/YwlC family)
MLIRINPSNINPEEIHKVVKALKDGALMIYPTDTVYAVGCDMMSKTGVEKLCRFKNIDPTKAQFTLVCHNISQISDYAANISNTQFKLLKKAFPGPYTFILEAGNKLPKLLKQNKKTIGVRVPDNSICKSITDTLGNPLLSSSLHDNEDEILDYYTDPEIIYERHEDSVDYIINGGFGNIFPSTIIDLSTDVPQLIRKGSGEISIFDIN